MGSVWNEISPANNIWPEVTAAFFGALLCVTVFVQRKRNLAVFRILVYLVTLADVLDVATVYITRSMRFSDFFVRAANTLNYYSFGVITVFLFLYLASYMHPGRDIARMKRMLWIAFLFDSFIHLMNFFVPIVISYDQVSGKYIRGPFALLGGFVIPLLCVTLSLWMLIRHQEELSRKQIRTLAASYAIVLIGCVIQAFTGAKFCIAYCAGVIGTYVLYFSVESPDYRTMTSLIARSDQAEKELKKSTRAREDLFAGMTHEIRTPLNTLRGLNELVRLQAQDEEVRETAMHIEGSGKRIEAAMNAVLGQAGETGHPSLSGMSVLCISADAEIQKILEEDLREAGAEVLHADTAEKAHAFLEKGRFDLLICEEAMKDAETCLSGDTPCILIHNGDVSLKKEQNGRIRFLGKPFGKDELLETAASFREAL
jgi:signal transduction histidine kinase